MKKSQMEVLGLIVIVILLFIGIFLLVTLGRQKASTFSTEYSQKLAMGFVSTVPDVGIPCGEGSVKMAEYIRACAASDGLIGCSGTHDGTCHALYAAINQTLNNSLSVWGYEYAFSIDALSLNVNNSGKVFCAGKLRKVAAEQAIPLSSSGNPALIHLVLCS